MILLFTISGCASGPQLTITSNSPAKIENNGIVVCDTTPCTIEGSHLVDEFNGCVRGANSNLVAFPLGGENAYRQSKVVFAGCTEEHNIIFDMTSGALVNTNQTKAVESKSTAYKLKEIIELKKEGLITDEEYKSKRKLIINAIQ